MPSKIEPVSLPPHLAFCQMWFAMWSEAMASATNEALHWYAMPFVAPHHHEAEGRFQIDVPEPFEDDEEQDLFA